MIKKITQLLIIIVIALSLFVTKLAVADSQPAFLAGDIVTAANNTRGGGWQNQVSALPGEAVEFRIVAQNQVPNTVANNVIVKGSLPSGSANSFTVTGTVTADNATAVSDTVTVTVQDGSAQSLVYIPGHARVFSNSCPSGCSASDSVVTSGVNVGNLGAGDSAQVAFKAYVSNMVTPTPTPTETPTPTQTPTPTPTITTTPTPTPVEANVISCPSGFVKTISGSNIICVQQVQSQSQTSNSSANASTGEINITASGGSSTSTTNVTQQAPAVPSTPQIVTKIVPVTKPVVTVTELPRTGLPAGAWLLSSLIPMGIGLVRKFRVSEKGEVEDSPYYLSQKRKFFKD